MSKVLKPIAAVAAVVASVSKFIPGVGQIVSTVASAVAVAASIGAALLEKKAKTPSEARNRLFATLDPIAPRKIVFGETAMATDVRYQAYTGTDQEYLHWIVCVAAHEVQSIDEIWFESEKAWSASGGVTSKYSGYLTITTRLVGTSGNGIGIDSVWTSSCTLTGCAYFHARFKLTGNSKKAESPFATSVPSRVTVRGKGAKLLDPRLSTALGGSGSQTTTQTTWTYGSGGQNPALQLLYYFLGWRIGGKLSVGRGIPAARIDMASFIAAANMCDETVSLAAGGTEPRYRSAGVFSEADSSDTVKTNLLAAMNGVLRDDGGRISLHILHNDLDDPDALHFTESDILGEESWRQTPSIDQTFNIVRGRYTDASDAGLYQLAEAPEVEIASFDDIDRIDQFDLACVQSASQWQRLAKQRLQRAQYAGVYSATFNARAWGTAIGRVVTLSHSGLGWSNKLFRVTAQGISMDGRAPLVLQEEHEDIYAWDEDEAPAVTVATPTVYDPTLSPVIAAIGDAAIEADLGDLATEDDVQLGAGGNVLRETGANLTDSAAVTSLGTSAAIAGQGALATVNSAAWDTQITGRPLERLFASNLLDMSGWEFGAPTTSGQFVDTVPVGQSAYAIIAGPDGGPEIVWKATADAGGGAFDGGWLNANVDGADGFDHAQPYLVAVWVMRPQFRVDGVSNTTGVAYFGPRDAGSAVTQRWNGSTWVDDINPYWMSVVAPDGTGTSDRGKWYLWLGLLHGSGFTGTADSISGIYDPRTGQRIYAASGLYRSKAGATTQGQRAFQYPGTPGNIMYFARPLFALAQNPGQMVRQLLATVGGQLGTNILRETGATLTDSAAVTNLGTAAAITGQGALATVNSADFATQVTGSAKPEASADVTKSVGFGPAGITVGYDYTGTVKAGQLGRNFQYKLITAAGTELSSGVTGHYRVISGGVNGKTSADGWVALSGSGTVTFALSSFSGTETVIQVRMAHSGQNYYSAGIPISPEQDAPPVGGGGGGGSGVIASNSPSTSINSTSYATITGSLSGTVPTGKTSVTVAANINLLAEEATPAGTWNVDVKLQRDVGGVWTDVGSAVASNPDTSVTNEGGGLFVRYVDGFATLSISDTGLTGGSTYAWRLQAKIDSGTKTVFVTGIATVTA